ncbi:MAG TPA: hypothetical protein DCW33_01785 [Proteobacteria bacterium]|nr:hypothetical protein [Pseudomonadota bacterium]
MQLLRDISKSRVSLVVTGVFALLMVVAGSERLFSTVSPTSTNSIERSAQHKAQRMIAAHQNEYRREPLPNELSAIQQQAYYIAHYQDRYTSYFKKHDFTLSTKQLLKQIQLNKNYEPLLQRLDNLDSNNRAGVTEQLKDIKDSILQQALQRTIYRSAIIPANDIERLRNAFMQERTYQWLKINHQYLIEEEQNTVNNEAEIQSYYETNAFPSTATAQIQYIRLKAPTIKRKPTVKELNESIQSGRIAPPKTSKHHLEIYHLTTQQGQQWLDTQDIRKQIDEAEIPALFRDQQQLHYTKTQTMSLAEEALGKHKLPVLPSGKSTFVKRGQQWQLIRNRSITTSTCTTTQCQQTTVNAWQKMMQQDQLDKLSARIQEEKLYHPKDISKVANTTNHKVETSPSISPHKLPKNLQGKPLEQSLFSSKDSSTHNRISEPVLLDSGDILFYQVIAYQPVVKRPLEDVRKLITTELHKQHIQQKLKNDLSVAIKQLHNGDGIDTLSKKFKARMHYSAPNTTLNELPTRIREAALNIPSGNIGWTKPVLDYDAESDTWYLMSLRTVVYTNKNNSSVDNIITDERLSNMLRNHETSTIAMDILS